MISLAERKERDEGDEPKHLNNRMPSKPSRLELRNFFWHLTP